MSEYRIECYLHFYVLRNMKNTFAESKMQHIYNNTLKFIYVSKYTVYKIINNILCWNLMRIMERLKWILYSALVYKLRSLDCNTLVKRKHEDDSSRSDQIFGRFALSPEYSMPWSFYDIFMIIHIAFLNINGFDEEYDVI